MRLIHYILFSFTMFLAACSGEPNAKTAIVGTWVQETPTSTTSRGLQTLTTDTILRLKKNGSGHLTRNLDITGEDLPIEGVKISVELRGLWEVKDDQLTQTQNSALIIPRDSSDIAKQWADSLQAQASGSHPSVKTILLVDKKQLIVQDLKTGTTDTYRRK